MGLCGRLISLVQAKIVGLFGPGGVSWPSQVCGVAHLIISATRYARTSNPRVLNKKGNGSPRQTNNVEIYVCHMPHAAAVQWVKFEALAFSKWVKVNQIQESSELRKFFSGLADLNAHLVFVF